MKVIDAIFASKFHAGDQERVLLTIFVTSIQQLNVGPSKTSS